MPLYEYLCTACSERTERIFSTYRGAAMEIPCSSCSGPAMREKSAPSFKMKRFTGEPPGFTDVDPFEGSGLAGSDGVNEEYYKSDKIQMDMGA